MAAWFLIGCVTTREVSEIVAESNAAVLASQVADVDMAGDPGAVGNKPDWQAASRRIDEFIAAHPGQDTAAGALRIRQAILLLAHGQFELARSAFAQATQLKTDRDKALKNLSEPMIWWWEHSQATALTSAQLQVSQSHLAAFDREIAKLDASPDIRDLLAEMRVRMALKRVASIQLADGTRKKDAFVDALNQYGRIFTPEDIAALRSGNLTPQSKAIATAEKRRLRALSVIDKAKDTARILRDGGQAVALPDLNESARGFGGLVLGSP